ncbi:MAG TPA: patatin-like phospholipase family protein [Pyrinomonadaceae bacterium]|nr:patatin-like phospholipase family protein [Pyrinomonadaceae bacterium]
MSENESAVVSRATDILGGKNSWTSDDLRGIERSLGGFGRLELAESIRALRVKDERKRAGEFIAGSTLKTDAARALERSLARDEQDDIVPLVRARRVERDVARAIEVLGGATVMQPDEMLELAKSLAEYKQMGYARRVLNRACAVVSRNEYPKLYTKIFQKAALYTYKDPDLPLEWKLDRAYKILGKIEDLAATHDTETLGLAGAIFKRKWEVDGKRQNLERALFYYLKGYAQGLPAGATVAERADVLKYLRENPASVLDASKDQGWNGLNAAFVLDVLAAQEDEEAARVGVSARIADERRAQARLIREELARSVPPLRDQPGYEWLRDEWWYYATVGEALFGLGRYEEAARWLTDEPERAGLRVGFDIKSSAGLDVPEWEYESTARQLARLARLQYGAESGDGSPGMISEGEFEKTEAAAALKKLLRGNDRAVRSTFRGKFGLGLSGGGFRASLYHIGVLARLAELDVLRHVEVLSCVSGGSILGAHYYLEVRRLLQTKADEEITREDYVEIVRRLEERFLRGVQRNIRTRVLAELTTNLKMIFRAGYSRTLRVGELYERELYSEVEDDEDGRGPVTGPRWLPDWLARPLGFRRDERLLRDLYIRPKIGAGADGGTLRQADFNPRSHNWRRENKAPILVLNATSLNTGHTWQFTASYMGEPPAPLVSKIDCNYRLRRLYYNDAPPNYPPVRLGHAVAASSCVPGLFEPIILDDLYPDSTERRISVRLVDGGVCDNQGIASLLEQDCTVMLISDGSGQMDALDVPSGGVLGVPLRSNSILQARVREAQYGDIAARRSSSVLRGLMFVHLKQDLSGESLAWRECPPSQKEYEFDREDSGAGTTGVTTYGVASDTQRRLAAVRTDLDSFCDAEAYALMSSAYRMTANQFRGADPCVEGFDGEAPSENWRFLEIEGAMKPRGKGKERLDKLLKAAANSAFKPWKLSPALIALKWALLASVVLGVLWAFYSRWESSVVPARVYEWAHAHLTFRGVAVFVLTIIAFAFLAAFFNFLVGRARGKYIMRVVKWRDTINYIAIGILMSVAGWLVARLHLHAFDPLYLRYGRIDKFPK